MSEQWIFGGSTSQLATGTTQYIACFGGATLQTSAPRVIIPWAAAGVMSDLHIWLSAAPGSGKSRTFSLDGGSGSGSNPTVTISDTDTEGSDTSNSRTIVAADEMGIQCATSNTPAAAYMRYAYKWTPTTAGEHIVGGLTDANQLSTTGAQYLPLGGVAPGASSTSPVINMLLPVPGDCYSLYGHLTTEPGAGNKDRRFQLRKNDSNESSTNFLISEAATTGNNTGNTVSCVAGDAIAWTSNLFGFGDPAPNASYFGYSMVFKPTDTDIFLLANHGNAYLPTATVTRYRQAQTGGDSWDASLTGRRYLTQEMFIECAYFWVNNLPSSGFWTTSLYNVSGEPNAKFASGGSAGQLVVRPKRVAADRAFAAEMNANLVPAIPPDNTTVLSACYACKTVLPVRSAPSMF
jgi:hypothetical protein